MDQPERAPERAVVPSQEHGQLALNEAAVLMAPIVRWLLRNGVSYVAFADLLKAVFVSVAREELRRGGGRATHSALSVLSGVHRKDVRALADAPGQPASLRSVPLASQVFTRWLSDPAYCGTNGAPRKLARNGPAPSFESLARQFSTDVHPRTVLEELARLGLVQIQGDDVVPRAAAFVPAQGLNEMTALFSANAADHIAAAVHNLTLQGPKFLEQSVFADGLSEASTRVLARVARDAWARAFETMVTQAQECVDADASAGSAFRMRFGVYYYSEDADRGETLDRAKPVNE